jgi:hypothetical protein
MMKVQAALAPEELCMQQAAHKLAPETSACVLHNLLPGTELYILYRLTPFDCTVRGQPGLQMMHAAYVPLAGLRVCCSLVPYTPPSMRWPEAKPVYLVHPIQVAVRINR